MREIKKKIIEILDAQEKKGIATYGHTLEDCPAEKYNWNQMALEELIDALQYQVKENIRLEKELNKQRNSIWNFLEACTDEGFLPGKEQIAEHLYNSNKEMIEREVKQFKGYYCIEGANE